MTPSAAIVVAFLTVAVTGCRPTAIPETERWPAGTAFRTRERDVAGSRVRMIDTGSGPAVVFLHGMASSVYSWRGLLGPVLDAGYRVVAFDNRGFGGSDRPDSGYTNASYAALLLALLDTLRIEQAVLVGHSMGAAIAADVAIGHASRVRGLVLIASVGYGVRAPWLVRCLRWPVIGRIAAAMHGRWATRRLLRSTYAVPARVTDRDVDQYHWSLVQPGSARSLRAALRSFDVAALRGRLPRLSPPTLLVWGARDSWTPLGLGQHMALELPNGALFVVPDAGHNVHEEQPAEVAQALLAFLRSGLPRPPADVAQAVQSGHQPTS